MPAVLTNHGSPSIAPTGDERDALFTTTASTAPADVRRVSRQIVGPPDSQSLWGWTRNDRWLLTISLLVMTALLTAHLWRDQQRQATPVEVAHPQGTYQFRVALNSASWVEWEQLDGIGETLARRIV